MRQSFDIAREALKASPYVPDSVLEGEKFVLLPEDALHDRRVFQAAPVSKWPHPHSNHIIGRGAFVNHYAEVNNAANWSSRAFFAHGLPSFSPDFEGREVDMYRVITTLLVCMIILTCVIFCVNKFEYNLCRHAAS